MEKKRLILTKENEFKISKELENCLEEILDCFGYEAKFSKIIELKSEGDPNMDENYSNLNSFLQSWIDTLEEGMEDDGPNYSDLLEVLKRNLV